MKATMMDVELSVAAILRHGAFVHGESPIVSYDEAQTRRATFDEVARRAERLARALRRLGVRRADRVATLSSNHQEHLEAYLAVPSMGAVLHTLNPRLSRQQLGYIVEHADDKVIIADAGFLPALQAISPHLRSVEHVLVVDAGGEAAAAIATCSWGRGISRYGDVIAAESPGFDWPSLDERSAAAMCYTSGTTGDPKGVVYSHRSIVLHSYALSAAACFGLTERDSVLPIVPMFHANAWGLPYAAWMTGCGLVFPGRQLDAKAVCRLVARERPTLSIGVPTVWNDVLRYSEKNPVDLGSLRLIVCGGSAVPRALMERFEERHGVRIVQAWGMTETSPLGALAFPPAGSPAHEEMTWRTMAGRLVPGVEARIVGPAGEVLPNDGKSVGEIEVRGPWVTGSYYGEDHTHEKFRDGWLRTGDVGSLDPRGYLSITDRAKDVIKSGGEWVSSVELENAIMAYADVAEAAVIAIPDARWEERPLACLVARDGRNVDIPALQTFLQSRVARWWIPEAWALVEELPRTSVGKLDKKALRAVFAEGALPVVHSKP
jgi:acyl-CoA synthetase (AMP-forming)/AMP-acid ligase II